MNVFVAGATGVIGERLVDTLTDRGHDVVGLVRDDAGEQLVERAGGTPRRGDVLEPDTLRRTVPEDVDTVVHAATALPPSMDAPDEAWERNDRVRVDGAENLVAAAGDEADRFVFPSVVWVARQPDGSAFDESAERHPDRFTASAARTENYLRDAGERHDFDVAVLRNGLFYGPDDEMTRTFADRLLSGDLPVIGGGLLGRRDAELSLLHVDDAGSAVAAAVEAALDGTYHVVDDEPVTVADYLSAFADRLGASTPSRIPWWVARPIAGKKVVDFMTTGFPTASDRFREETGWEPAYPTYRDGLAQVVETWERDGTLAELTDGQASDNETSDETSADGVDGSPAAVDKSP